jgi:ribose/xylose/arabinose/galactoside ABC-type transport system permease subunit
MSSPAENQSRFRKPRQALPAQLGPLIGLIGFSLLLCILRNISFANLDNLQSILKQTAVVATAALGMTIIIISGGIDLSVGPNIALCSVVVALLLNAGASPWLAAGGAVMVGCFIGAIIGLFVGPLGMVPFVATLGMWGALRGAAIGLAGQNAVHVNHATWLDDLLHTSRSGHEQLILPGVWIALTAAVLVAAMLRYTRFGRHVFAIGSNEATARLCGIHVRRNKLMIYALAGLLTGLAGVLQFSVLTQGDPTSANGMELDVIAAVVIGGASLSGGQGGVFGTIIGALLMTVIANGCSKFDFIPNWVQQIVTGGIIILAAGLDQFRRRRME